MKSIGKSAALLAVAAVMGAAAVRVALAAEEADSAPATTAASGPREDSNISVEAVELSPNERTALGAVRDGTSSLDETAFYMLLANIAKRPPLSPREIERLARPTVKGLLACPEAYRAQAVEMTLHVARVKKLSPGQGLSYTLDWPKDRPVWRIDGLNAAAQYPGDEPVVVMSVVEPTLQADPSRVEDNGDRLYFGLGPALRVVGVFYKVYRAQTLGDKAVAGGTWQSYPVLLAWQLEPAGAGKGPGSDLRWRGAVTALPLLLAVLVLLGGYIFLRQMARRKQVAAPPSAAAYRRDRRNAPDDEGQDEVDPLLKAASREYRKERLGEDDPVDPR